MQTSTDLVRVWLTDAWVVRSPVEGRLPFPRYGSTNSHASTKPTGMLVRL